MVQGLQGKGFSQLAAQPSREVVEILASLFSQSEQLEGMFVCAVTGYGKMQCSCTISVAFARTFKPYMSSSQGVALFCVVIFTSFTLAGVFNFLIIIKTASQAG